MNNAISTKCKNSIKLSSSCGESCGITRRLCKDNSKTRIGKIAF